MYMYMYYFFKDINARWKQLEEAEKDSEEYILSELRRYSTHTRTLVEMLVLYVFYN